MQFILYLVTATIGAGDPAVQFRAVSPKGTTPVRAIQKQQGAAAIVVTETGQRLPLASFVRIESELDLPLSNRETAPSAGALPAPRRPWQIRWSDGEAIRADAAALDAEHAAFTSALGKHRIPRERLWSIESAFPGAVVLQERFGPAPVAEAAAPTTGEAGGGSPGSQGQRLVAGQRIARPAPHAVATGALSLTYYDDGGVHAGRRWSVTLFLEGSTEPAVRIAPGWERRFALVATSDNLYPPALPVARRTGWHELTIRFSPAELVISLDGAALLSSLRRGLARPLVRFEIDCAADPTPPTDHPSAGEAAAWLGELVLTEQASLGPVRRLLPDPSQADLLDRQGDQWLGDLQTAGPEGLVLRSAYGSPTLLRWPDVRSLRLPQKSVPPAAPLSWAGEIGTLMLQDGSQLTVALETAAADHWSIRHPLLGAVIVPRSQLQFWTPRTIGRRQEILVGPVHLGAKLVSEFRRPLPDGRRLQSEFDSGNPASRTELTLWVNGLESMDTAAPFAARLRAGALQSTLWLNGKQVAVLNQFVPAAASGPIELRLPLPATSLKPGRNTLEIRQQPDPATGDYDDAEFSTLAVEQAAG